MIIADMEEVRMQIVENLLWRPWLLSGVDPSENRGRNQSYYTVDLSTDTGILVAEFNKLEKQERDRILGYVAAFVAMQKEKQQE